MEEFINRKIDPKLTIGEIVGQFEAEIYDLAMQEYISDLKENNLKIGDIIKIKNINAIDIEYRITSLPKFNLTKLHESIENCLMEAYRKNKGYIYVLSETDKWLYVAPQIIKSNTNESI